MKKEIVLPYTTIRHQARKELNISLEEYCVADCIYNLSNSPESKIRGWCYSSKSYIAKFIQIGERTVFRCIDTLIKKGIIEKDEETKYLRTTKTWYTTAIIAEKPTYDKVAEGMPDRQTDLCQTGSPTYDKVADNNNKDNKIDNNIILAEPSSAGRKDQKIFDLIEAFNGVNPSYQKFFANTTQRQALERLTKKVDSEKLKEIIRFLPKTNQQKYAPSITTPLQLEDKLAQWLAFMRKIQDNKINKIAEI